MKKLLLNTLLLVITSILSLMTTNAQTMPPISVKDLASAYPITPTPTDSIFVAYSYISSDACPDYYLTKDSVVDNKIYISKKKVNNTGMCAQVISNLVAFLNLGLLKENTQIYFEGILIKTVSYSCNMDKIGVIIAGTGGCTGQLYIQETTIYLSALQRLWALPKATGIYTKGSSQLLLKAGDKVKFGGYEIKNDSNSTSPCRIIGVATCYEVNPTPPVGCVKDKKGIVVTGQGECAGKLFIQEYSPISSSRQLYSIQGGDTITSNATATTGLKDGDQIIFGGYLTKNDSNTTYVCRTVGVATCYELVTTPPVCVMDKVGAVVEFMDNSSIIKEDATGDIYAINNVKLATGTKIKFKGTKIVCITTPCYNIVECYTIISIPPCVKDKEGVVVAGTGGCTGQLFIEETTPYMSAIRRLYVIKNIDTDNSTSTVQTELKAGDKVRFGGYLTTNDSSKVSLCFTIGVATCYELIPSENTYTLSGSVLAGTELMKSGLAILYKKGYFKAIASNTITDGTFIFTNLPKADYTIYVIPNITVYQNYLPTFYSNKSSYKKADYLTLDKNVLDIVVNLKQFVLPKGTGKIFGNIFFESYTLKDSILVNNGLQKTLNDPMNNLAVNTPVILYNSNNEPIAWTTTDAYGNYTFENIPFDTYKIVSETASAEGESNVSLTSGNSTANADLLLKSSQTQTDIVNPGNVVLNVFPNPVADKLTITLTESKKIDIYSATGELLIHQDLKSGDNTVDLSAINKGVYFAKIGKATIKVIKK